MAALKQADGGDLHVIGSTELVRTLIEHGLVDELRLMIDPVVLGGGKRIFRDDGVAQAAAARRRPGHGRQARSSRGTRRPSGRRAT